MPARDLPAPAAPAALPRNVAVLALVDGAGTGVHQALVAVLLARRFGLVAAGLMGLGYLGRLVALGAARHLERTGADGRTLHRWFTVAAWTMAAGSLATLAAAWRLPLAAALAGQVVFASANSLTGSMAASVVLTGSARFFPVAQVGIAAGSFVAAWAAAASSVAAAVVVAVVVLAQLAEPVLLARSPFPELHAPPLREVARSVGGPALVAVVAWGPLLVYSALVVQASSPAWVGWAMAAYAAGGLLAGRLDVALRRGNGWPGVLVLAAVGVGTWVLAVDGPLLAAGRFVSGMVLFVAQARIYRLVAGDPSQVSQAKVAAVGTGLGLGCGAGAVACSALAAGTSVPVMGAVLAALALALAAAAAVRARRH